MTSALAIAGVSAVLRDILTHAMTHENLVGITGTSVAVSAEPPDRVVTATTTEQPQLNLFMYQITSNSAWRNEGMPSLDASGTQRLSNAPMALNLHYLLTAYGNKELHGEVLLGYAMQALHEIPVLSRGIIHKVFNPQPQSTDPIIKALMDAGLESQFELVKITPEYLNTDEMSRLWTATQSHLRPSAAYKASVVLIQAEDAATISRPVLRRGADDRGVAVQLGASPSLRSVSIGPPAVVGRIPAPPSWPSARLGSGLIFHGERLSGEKLSLRFEHPLMPPMELEIAQADRTDKLIKYNLPLPTDVSAQTTWAAGIYTVTALVANGGNTRSSNKLPLALAPRITKISTASAPDPTSPSDIDVTLTITTSPHLPVEANGTSGAWKLSLKQMVNLHLAGIALAPDTLADSSSASKPETINQLSFTLKKAPALSNEIVTLRVDGVDSLPFQQASPSSPPNFDTGQMVTIP